MNEEEEEEETINKLKSFFIDDYPPELNPYIVMLEHLVKEWLLNLFDMHDAIAL